MKGHVKNNVLVRSTALFIEKENFSMYKIVRGSFAKRIVLEFGVTDSCTTLHSYVIMCSRIVRLVG